MIESLQTLGDALLAPADAFHRLAARPRWALALLLVVAIQFVTATANLAHVDLAGGLREQIKAQSPRASSQEIDEAVELGLKASRFSAAAGAAFLPISLLIVSVALLLAFQAMGGDVNLSAAFSTTVYAWLPQSIKSMLVTLLVVRAGEVSVTASRTILRTSLGFLVDPLTQRPLFALLDAVDIFDFWTIGLLSTGFAATSRLPRLKALAVVAGCHAAAVALRVGIAAALG